MTLEACIAIGLAALALLLLGRHLRALLGGEAGGCGCCKGACRGGDDQASRSPDAGDPKATTVPPPGEE
ncbi:MAG: hypothetical protein GVY16_07925 [Planctomycetes bacterium]|nr:hypothetical protein [Planctomycetota bacterium]